MKVNEIITNRIIGLLEKGTVPWKKPWTGGEAGIPKNMVSGKQYNGINVFLLMTSEYCSPYFLTYKQAKDLKGNVKEGEKGFPVVYFDMLDKGEKINSKGETVKDLIPFMRYYTVFNVAQCSGILDPYTPKAVNKIEAIEACEKLVHGYLGHPEIKEGQARAFYSPSLDYINMPQKGLFKSSEEYYSTLFHELTHSTGHEKRLNRKENGQDHHFGSESYSKEELVAEMGSCFMSGHAGIENKTIENSASYIASWIKVLKADPQLVISAAAKAQKAYNYMLDHNKSEEL